MPEKLYSLLGAAAIVAAIVYVSVMYDSAMCYKVPGCPTIRSAVLGY